MISLAVIARNEERCIARCLKSAAPYVDEIVLADTGSSDATVAIARSCGARVAHFSWCDDFAAARNFALAQASGHWRLVLDADEWIEAGADGLWAALPEGDASFVGAITICSGFDDAGAVRLARSRIVRVLPRGIEFAGRIHEQAAYGQLPVRALPLRVGHDGYRAAQRGAKAGRNERLLRQSLCDAPDSAYLHFQLGKDLEIQGRYAEAAAQYQSARERLAWPPQEPAQARALCQQVPWLHDLVVRHIFCRKRAGLFDAALAQCAADAPWWDHSPDFHFAQGDLLLDLALARPEHAPALLPRIEAQWLRCLEIGEAPHLEGAVEGRGSHLAERNLAVFRGVMASQASVLG